MEDYNTKRVLVTGGAGFLGSHLCERLLEDGNDVVCVDNFFTGSKDNIRHLVGHSNFELLRHDITFPLYVEVDEIYNLACPASPIHYQSDPILTFKTNIIGAMNVLENAYKNNSLVFHASTSEIYGDPLKHPQKENYLGNVSTTGPRACYDEGKRGAETIFFDYERKYKTKIRVARIFNTYGPNMQLNDGRVISNFIVQCLKNKPITIYGNGHQTRSFCYVNDLIDAIVKFTNNDLMFEGPINLGNPDEYKIIEIAKIIKKITNSKSKIIFKNKVIDDPFRRKPDISLAKKILEWKPKISIDQGLR